MPHHSEVLRSLHVVVDGGALQGGVDLHPGGQVPDLYLAGGEVGQRQAGISLNIIVETFHQKC